MIEPLRAYVLSKVGYLFNAIGIKIPMILFIELEKNVKIFMETYHMVPKN